MLPARYDDDDDDISISIESYKYIYICTPGQNYKTTLKNEGKDMVYNF